MKRQLFIGNFFTKKPKGDSEIGDPCISTNAMPTMPSTSKNSETDSDKTQHDSLSNSDLYNENDIGLYLKIRVDDFKKEMLLNHPWKPPSFYTFPASTNRCLKFQRSWMEKFSWLVYSQKLEGALCKVCVLFSPEEVGKGSHQHLGALVNKSYTNWKNALEDFSKHAATAYHKRCFAHAENFLSVADGKIEKITNQLSSEHAQQTAENRQKLRSIVETIILCGRQELALRGTNDFGKVMNGNCRNVNDGNFRALLRFRISSGDSIINKHLESGLANAQYTSPLIQNELIQICGSIIKEEIVKKVNAATCFSVMADETTDISQKEQLSICLRYVDEEKGCIREAFLEFVPTLDLTGKGLAKLIIDSLKSNNINCEYLVGQGYDGAAAFSGYLHGAQACIQKDFPMALYVHCSAHSLNLALSNSSSLPLIRNFMGTLQSVATFFQNSAKRTQVLKDSISEISPQSKRASLVAFCETRWVQKHESIIRFKELYSAIILALERLEISGSCETSKNAFQLLSAIQSSKFVLPLLVTEKIFACTLPLCKALQEVNADISEACEYVDNVLDVFENFRRNADEDFNVIFEEASAMLLANGGVMDFPRITAKQIHRENVPSTNCKEYYKLNLYIQFLDHVKTQLCDRFTKHKYLISSLQKLIPSRCLTINPQDLEECITFYATILPQAATFNAEFFIWQSKWKTVIEKPNSAIESFFKCNKSFFPNIHKLLQILATLPVSTSTPERTFSTLRRLKTYLRNSTGNTRLTGLALMSIHRDINLNVDDVIDRFSKSEGKRRIVL